MPNKKKSFENQTINGMANELARDVVKSLCKDGKLTPQGRSLAKLMDRIMPADKVDEWGWNLSRKERAAIKRRAAEKRAADEARRAEARARAAARAARAPAHPGGVAPVAAGARVEPPPVEGLRGLHAAAQDLPLDGRAGYPRLAADLRERLALAQRGFQREAQVVRQVLVLLLLDCHLGILSSLRRGVIAVPVGKDAIFRLQGKAGISACRTNRAGSPVAPAHLLFQSTPWKPRPSDSFAQAPEQAVDRMYRELL